MNLAISGWEVASREEWDRTWSSCAFATRFESPGWAEHWQHATNGALTPVPRVVTFSDGVRALLPLSQRRIWCGLDRTHELCPAGTFGGWLATDELLPTHAALLTDHLVAEVGNLTWRVSPYSGVTLPAHVATEPDVTHAIDLRGGLDAVEAIWRRSSNARKVRKAEAAGVTITQATNSGDWRDYFDIYRESLARWGDRATSQYDWRVFELLSAAGSSHVRLWLAKLDERVVAGAVCLYAPHHVAYWHGAARESAFACRPVNLLMATAVRHAAEHGHDWFDLNPSGGHEGVQRFKESLGATPLPCPVVRTEKALRRGVRQLVGRGARA